MTGSKSLAGVSSITGIGQTEFSKHSGKTVLALAAEAAVAAINDSGLAPSEIDGVVSFAMDDSVACCALASALGLPGLSYYADLYAGGNMSSGAVVTAAMAIQAGMANNVLVFRALNGRSGHRFGGGERRGQSLAAGDHQFTEPIGWTTYAQIIAMQAQRYIGVYGDIGPAFRRIAIDTRENALRNPSAQMKAPLTVEEYESSDVVVDPFRKYDMCLETDGACAVIVSRTDRARDCKQPVVSIAGGAIGSGPKSSSGFGAFLEWPDPTDNYAHHISQALYAQAGVSPSDVDFAELYDCFTFSVVSQLEGFGFCNRGQARDYFDDNGLGPDSPLPINTHGGLLSEAYIHGVNHIVEAVRQLRGSATNQVEGAEVGLTSGYGVSTGSALILTRDGQ